MNPLMFEFNRLDRRIKYDRPLTRIEISKLIFVLFVCIILLLLITSCATVSTKESVNQLHLDTVQYPEPEVKLNPGDVIELRFFFSPELNAVQTIRPDGKIMLQLLGDVMAQGKTPAELKNELTKSYSVHLKQIDITIIVQSYSNRRVYVGGQVLTPGSIPMPGRLTVPEALILAGGVNLTSGKYKDVVVIRNRDGKWSGQIIDLKSVFRGEITQAMYLQPLDIVYVPESTISKIDRWIAQHIGTILPRVGFTYSYTPDVGGTFGIDTTYDIGQ